MKPISPFYSQKPEEQEIYDLMFETAADTRAYFDKEHEGKCNLTDPEHLKIIKERWGVDLTPEPMPGFFETLFIMIFGLGRP